MGQVGDRDMGRNFKELFRKPSDGRRAVQTSVEVTTPVEDSWVPQRIEERLKDAYESGREAGEMWGYESALQKTVLALENMPARTGKQQMLKVLKERLEAHRRDNDISAPHVLGEKEEDSDG